MPGEGEEPVSPELVLVAPEHVRRAVIAALALPPPPSLRPLPLVHVAPPREPRRRRPSPGQALAAVALGLACSAAGWLASGASVPLAGGGAAPALPPAVSSVTPTVTAATPPLPAVRGGGYLIVPRGHLRVSANGRRIEEALVYARCARSGLVLSGAIAADGRFAARGGARGTRATLAGRFVSPWLARGVVRFRGGTCRSRAVAFAARLS